MYRHAKVGVIKTFTLLDRYKLPPLSVSVGGESLTLYFMSYKRIFGSEETKNTVLLPFLNEILRKTEVTPLTTIKLLNPYIDREMLLDKQSILDIRAQGDGGKQINRDLLEFLEKSDYLTYGGLPITEKQKRIILDFFKVRKMLEVSGFCGSTSF
jgi:PD-(D/E)XK nuclease family transposase